MPPVQLVVVQLAAGSSTTDHLYVWDRSRYSAQSGFTTNAHALDVRLAVFGDLRRASC